jgi:hypothetical protein
VMPYRTVFIIYYYYEVAFKTFKTWIQVLLNEIFWTICRKDARRPCAVPVPRAHLSNDVTKLGKKCHILTAKKKKKTQGFHVASLYCVNCQCTYSGRSMQIFVYDLMVMKRVWGAVLCYNNIIKENIKN